jgi:hypothetical protein
LKALDTHAAQRLTYWIENQDNWDTYDPVVTWASICLLLIMAKIHSLQLKSIDFVLAFPQTDLNVPIYMELPAGINPVDVSDIDHHRYVLKLNKSLYGSSKQDSIGSKNYKRVIAQDFIQSQVNKCVFFSRGCIILTYVDDCIILGQNMIVVDSVILLLKDGIENFDLVEQGSINKYLSLLIRDINSTTFEMSQPFLILHIIDFLSLE